ncbi:MAG: hypothetical protein OXR68_05875, partial [Alphaproteobacteria bacterium]|nr:hypothetical protein [Alphaproteobacteria bacterium]
LIMSLVLGVCFSLFAVIGVLAKDFSCEALKGKGIIVSGKVIKVEADEEFGKEHCSYIFISKQALMAIASKNTNHLVRTGNKLTKTYILVMNRDFKDSSDGCMYVPVSNHDEITVHINEGCICTDYYLTEWKNRKKAL